jgi:hypothetical protein
MRPARTPLIARRSVEVRRLDGVVARAAAVDGIRPRRGGRRVDEIGSDVGLLGLGLRPVVAVRFDRFLRLRRDRLAPRSGRADPDRLPELSA